jgi:uncharacterized protein
MSYAVITGASGGIGQSIAMDLAKKGYGLILIARNESALQSLASKAETLSGKSCYYLAADLSKSDSAQKVVDFCKSKTTDISILVNNAGYGLWGSFDRLTLEEQMNMMQLNMVTMVQLSYLFVPLLKQQKRSYLLNVASTAGYQAVPLMSIYAASKSFVIFFSRGLRYEMRKSPLSVTVISPGPTSTGFMNRAGMKEDWLVKRSEKYSMTSDQVAGIAVKAMFKGKAEIVPGFLNALAARLTAFAPKILAEKIAAGLYVK